MSRWRPLMALAVLLALGLPPARDSCADDGEKSADAEVVRARLQEGDLPRATAAYETSRTDAWTPERRDACDALARAWTRLAAARAPRVRILRGLVESCVPVLSAAQRAREEAELHLRERKLDLRDFEGRLRSYVPPPTTSDPPPWYPPDPSAVEMKLATLRRAVEAAMLVHDAAQARHDRWAQNVDRARAALRRSETLWLQAVEPAAAYHTESLRHQTREERKADPDRLLLAADLNRQVARLLRRGR